MNRTGQKQVIALAGLAGTALVAVAWMMAGVRIGLLAVVGVFAGLALYQASFGFTSAWRQMLTRRRGVGVRAQVVMLALTILVFFPLLARPSALGHPLSGFLNPVGVALCLGAFLFGIGMQLGGGCGSGTLYTAGGGNSRMMVTLGAFVLGSLIATANPLDWLNWPSLGAYSIIETLGLAWALILALGALAAIYLIVLRIEASAHECPQPLFRRETASLMRGPWTLLFGAIALAFVNIATLILIGRPWGITSAFALWGAKVAIVLGLDATNWTYWRGDPSLSQSIFNDPTSVMDLAIIIGAFGAAGLRKEYSPQGRVQPSLLAASLIGGVLMGIGARLATGCNIGAFYSGVASGSLHGVVWLLFALPGNAVGIRLRPIFGLPI